MLTGQMEDRPQVTWSGGRPGELYTIMILDEVRKQDHLFVSFKVFSLRVSAS